MCNVKTFTREPISGQKMLDAEQPVSSDELSWWQETNINPRLKNCGELPECQGCQVRAFVDLQEMTSRVAKKIKRADL